MIEKVVSAVLYNGLGYFSSCGLWESGHDYDEVAESISVGLSCFIFGKSLSSFERYGSWLFIGF